MSSGEDGGQEVGTGKDNSQKVVLQRRAEKSGN